MESADKFSETQCAALRELSVRARRMLHVTECGGNTGGVATEGRPSVLFTGVDSRASRCAAEQLARALGRDLYRVALAAVVSKYLGETEKNLSRVLETAEKTGAVLLLDEGDALFGRTGEGQDGEGRAMVTADYVLQRIEGFSGLAIVACHRRLEELGIGTRRFGSIIELQAK